METKMSLATTVPWGGASLPQTYQNAQAALAQCSKVDECKEWADKAAALASYAKQADDNELQVMAQRIRARAIRRAGELLKQLDPATGTTKKDGSGPLSRKDAAYEAGMSERQHKQALRVANIPEQDFVAQVDGSNPPTISKLAEQGTKKREPLIDLKGRDPKEYNRALHYVGDFEYAARELTDQAHEEILPTLTDKERARLRAAIQKIDAITDKVSTRI